MGVRTVAGMTTVLLATLGGGGGPVRVSGPSPFARCTAGGASLVGSEVEPSLAVDRKRPRRIVAAYQQDRNEGAGARGIVAATSVDGGRTWHRKTLPVSLCAGHGSPFATDPWVSIGAGGRAYVAALGRGISVVTSGDGGRNWTKPVEISGPNFADKESITADPTRPGVAYLVWSDYLPTNPPGTESDELLSITRDGGRTWSRPRPILLHGDQAGPLSSQILVDARTGRLYDLVSWVQGGYATPGSPAQFFVVHSDDGGATWTKAQELGIGRPASGRRGPVIRTSPAVPSFAIDDAGTLYAAWQDARFSAGRAEQIVFTRSRDGGATWAAPRRVEGADVATILPAIAAGGNGCVAILYLQLGSPDVLRGARYRTVVSTDGGRTFTGGSLGTSFDLSRAPRIKGDVLVPSGYFVGDYLGLAPLGGSRFGAAFVVTTAARSNPTVLLYAAFGSGA